MSLRLVGLEPGARGAAIREAAPRTKPTAPVCTIRVPLPEGASYLGFIFARAPG